ncbi:MAG: AAA family ATPase [Cyanothece sp. SIO2G6]|nr:AAA family ATPase [Cyanothece sp. SIO2G6]
MLEDIKLHNFKSHSASHLKFDGSRLNALVGPNSAGKTSVLQATYFLSRLGNSQFDEVFAYESSPDFFAAVGQNNLSVIGSGFWGRGQNRKNWEVSYTFQYNDKINKWEPEASWKMGNNGNQHRGWFETLENAPHPIPTALKHSVHLKLVATNLAQAAYSSKTTPRVEFDGSGLAPTLDYLRDEVPDNFELLQEQLKRIVPGVKKVGLRRATVTVNRSRLIEVDGRSISYEESQKVTGQEVVLDMNTGQRIPAHCVSEGTILALGLLTVLLHPKQPNLLLLDDVEQGLHPKAQRALISVFKEIIEENSTLQIIFSTHSPYIVDELKPSQIHVLNNRESGFTHTKRLDEHPDIEWAKQTLTTGEFWDAEGEDWVLDGEIDG